MALGLAVAAAFVAAQAAADARHVRMEVLTRDVAALAELKWYAGFFSNLGTMAWGGAIALGGFGYAYLRGTPSASALARNLAGFTLVSALLGLDDVFQIHEEVVPGHLGLSERWVFAVEGLAMGTWLLGNRVALLRHVPFAVAASLAGFGVSLGVDLVDHVWAVPLALEDGAKLFGILNWVAAGALLLVAGLRAAANGAAAPGDAP